MDGGSASMPVSRGAGTAPRVMGVDLKAAEFVTMRLLKAGLAHRYTLCPPVESTAPDGLREFLDSKDPFFHLHRALDPASRERHEENGRKFGVPPRRASAKRAQVISLVKAVASVVACAPRPGVIADLCGGAGHVGVVLAALLPSWKVCIVDAKGYALAVAKDRAADAGLSNVLTIEMDVANAGPPALAFDIGVSLHACGDASDLVLDAAVRAGAAAVVAPCCVGSIVSKRTRGVPNIQATQPRWEVPRGDALRLAVTSDDYRLLVRAADFGDSVTGPGAWRRAAKVIVEGDRAAWLESEGYQSRIVKMEPLSCSPKNDILVAWPQSWAEKEPWEEDEVANKDVEGVLEADGLLRGFDSDVVSRVREILRLEVCDPDSCGEVEFPRGRGSQHRKAVHAVAESLSLYHMSEGEGSNRRVIVRRSCVWPLYFHGFVGYGGRWVEEVTHKLIWRVPEGHVRRRVDQRGCLATHITLVPAREMRFLPPMPREELLQNIKCALESGAGPSLVGLGRVVDELDPENEVYFAIVDWPAAADVRRAYGLPPADFHITLGFAKRDVHNVAKDRSTLIEALTSFESGS